MVGVNGNKIKVTSGITRISSCLFSWWGMRKIWNVNCIVISLKPAELQLSLWSDGDVMVALLLLVFPPVLSSLSTCPVQIPTSHSSPLLYSTVIHYSLQIDHPHFLLPLKSLNSIIIFVYMYNQYLHKKAQRRNTH